MAELIAFLIEHFHDFSSCPSGSDLGSLLEANGFDDRDIGHMLMLLAALDSQPPMPDSALHSGALRIYCAEEQDHLGSEVAGFLHFLEQAGALNPMQREFVIHALLGMPSEEVDTDMAKLISLLVLWAHQSELPVLIGDELMAVLQEDAVMQ